MKLLEVPPSLKAIGFAEAVSDNMKTLDILFRKGVRSPYGTDENPSIGFRGLANSGSGLYALDGVGGYGLQAGILRHRAVKSKTGAIWEIGPKGDPEEGDRARVSIYQTDPKVAEEILRMDLVANGSLFIVRSYMRGNQVLKSLSLGVDDGSYTQGLLIAKALVTASLQLATTSTATLAAINVGAFAGDPSTLANGDIWYNSTTGKFRARENGVTTNLIVRQSTLYKSADESVNSSTTVQDDDHLAATLSAGVKYRFRIFAFITNVGAAAGFRCTLGGTATITDMKAQICIWDNNGSGSLSGQGRITAFGTEITSNIGANDGWVEINGTIDVNAGGTFKLKWAQNVSDGSNTTVQKNSELTISRID